MGKLIMSNNKWQTSVTELLAIFNGALLALIPWLEKAKIKWKEGEAYDDWDNIAESLYNNIVCASLTGEVTYEYSMAKYNFNYDDYSVLDFIEVRSKNVSEKKFVFISFLSGVSPFDKVKVAQLDKDYKVIDYANLENNELLFLFIKRKKDKIEIIDKIEVAP